jgi:hypothetical protein
MDHLNSYHPDENQIFEEPDLPLSPLNVFFSIGLLILGLTLTSVMFFYYGLKNVDLSWQTAIDELAQPNDPTWVPPPITAETFETQPEIEETAPSPFKNLFQKRDEVKWPRLTVTGFGRVNDGTGGFAIINGEQVMLNNFIGDVKLVEVREHDIVVEYQGARKNLVSTQR